MPENTYPRTTLTLEELLAPFRSGDKNGQQEILNRHCSSFPGKTDELGKALGELLLSKQSIDADSDEHIVTALRVISPFAPASIPSIVKLLGREDVVEDEALTAALAECLASYGKHAPRALLSQAEPLGELLECHSGCSKTKATLFELVSALGSHAASQTGRIIRMFEDEKLSEQELYDFVSVLGGTGDEALVEALGSLEDGDYGSRYERGLTVACGELSVIGIMKLGELLETDDSAVLRRALYALQSYGDRPGFELEHAQARQYLPRIVELLEHDTYPVPLFAIETIGRLARPDDAAAVAGLSAILNLDLDDEEAQRSLKRAASKSLFLLFHRDGLGSPRPSEGWDFDG